MYYNKMKTKKDHIQEVIEFLEGRRATTSDVEYRQDLELAIRTLRYAIQTEG